jgi:hypothetical protein
MAQADDLPDNWGRWGEDDESGTLNLITDAVRARAAAEVRTGRAVSLAMPVRPTPVVMGPFAPDTMEASPVQQLMALTPPSVAADVVLVTNPGAPSPLHKIALVRLGMPLIDAASVEELAAACAQLSRHSFLLSVAPPRILGMTGIPVNPLAIF